VRWGGLVLHRLGAMKQLTLATVGFERYAKTTRRAAFLNEMDRVVPDETTVCRFRHLLEEHGLGRRVFDEV
jgi:transposase, IS5 family